MKSCGSRRGVVGCNLRDGGGLEAHDFLVKKLLELFPANVVLVQIELEEFGVQRGGDRLIIRVMLSITRYQKLHTKWQMGGSTYICLKIWMGQSLLDSNPLLRVESLRRQTISWSFIVDMRE